MIFGQRTACSLPWQRIQIPIYFHNSIQNCWESTGHKLRKLSGSLWPSWICIWQRVDWMSNTNKHQLVTFLHRQLSSLHLAYCTIPTTSPISWPWGAGYTRIVAPSFAAWACPEQALWTLLSKPRQQQMAPQCVYTWPLRFLSLAKLNNNSLPACTAFGFKFACWCCRLLHFRANRRSKGTNTMSH